jgi:hypothetical protein
MNQGLVQKQQQQAGQNKTKIHFGTARVLIVEEAIKKQEGKKAKEQQVKGESCCSPGQSRLCKGCLEGASYGF